MLSMNTKTKNRTSGLLKAVKDSKLVIRNEARKLKQHAKAVATHFEKGFSDGTGFEQSEFGVEVFNMTPAEAMDILKHRNSIVKDNTHIQTNRRIDERIVERIKNELLNDDWFFESAHVSFNQDGTIIDGQHTLAGIAAAGKEAPVLLKTGCRNKSVQKIDVSRSRTTGQRLKFSGAFPLDESDVSSKFRADIAGLILRSTISLTGKKKKNGKLEDRSWYSDKQVIASHNEHKAGINYFLKNKSPKRGFKKIGLMAPLVLAFKDNPKKAKDFYNRFLNPNVKCDSRNTSPIGLRNLVDSVLRLKASKEIDGNLFSKLMKGRSEVSFWFAEATRAVECFINNKTYTPNV